MPREKEHYREQLARLDELYPDKEVLTTYEAADVLGVCERSVRRNVIRTPLGGVSKIWLASYMVTKRKES